MVKRISKELLYLVFATLLVCKVHPSYASRSYNDYNSTEGDWQRYDGLDDIPEGSMTGFGGGMPSSDYSQGEDGSMNSMGDYDSFDPYANAYSQQSCLTDHHQAFDLNQSGFYQTQDPSAMHDSVSRPVALSRRAKKPYKSRRHEVDQVCESSVPPSLGNSKRAAREKFLAQQRSNAESIARQSQQDEALMCAWGVFKVLMNLPDAKVDPKDPLWIKFNKNQTAEIIEDLNSGDMQKMLSARSLFSKQFILNLNNAIQNLPLSAILDEYNLALSEWAWQDCNGQGGMIDQLVMMICAMLGVPTDGEANLVAQKFWKGRLLTRSNHRNIEALVSGVTKRQHWALADLANLSF